MNNKPLVFAMLGSVDHGKSTLIGRLLYQCHALPLDKIQELKDQSAQYGMDLNFALVTDGLSAEREQSITIDTAYSFFASSNRRYISIDCPGHKQYTANMLSGITQADCSVLLIDINLGLTEQSHRHLAFSLIFSKKPILVCVNKIDLCANAELEFNKIKEATLKLQETVETLNPIKTPITFIPVSAINGDNVIERSSKYPWYTGPTFFEYLENFIINQNQQDFGFMPIQYVINTLNEPTRKRSYAGKIIRGTLAQDDEISLYPSHQKAKIQKIYQYKSELNSASESDSVAIELNRDLDLSRGDIIYKSIDAKFFDSKKYFFYYFGEQKLNLDSSISAIFHTKTVTAQIERLHGLIDVEKFKSSATQNSEVSFGDFFIAELVFSSPIIAIKQASIDAKLEHLVFVDEVSGETIGLGVPYHV